MLTMNTEFYRESINHHGLGLTLFHAAYRAANHVTEVAVWDALMIDMSMVRAEFRIDERHPPGRMLEAEEMRRYVADPANLLSDAFIDDAARKGDRCYVLCEGDALMSYGWYSTWPTRLTEMPGHAVLHFDPAYAYMYNGFTRPEYRGRRLHAIGMAAALAECTKDGLKGLLSYVVSSNFASLKSCERMGYETFGHLVMVKVGARYVWHESAGCAKYAFYVETRES
jgi:hypothetical protein